MRILSEIIGAYSQTIQIYNNFNVVKVKRNGEDLFYGEATEIIDSAYAISFKDKKGKQYVFDKPNNNEQTSR